MGPVSFDVDPAAYRHWKVSVVGPVATVAMDVDPAGGLTPGYELKLNSYDLGVDIELADIVQRLRFGHPEVRAVVLTSAKDRMFSAGANIRMLAAVSHPEKVNFCKFTNETRAAIEDASACSGQVWLAAVNGPASGGGYELALACAHIMLVDDRSSTVAMPELPLLGVLPATGGLTRLVDKRYVRRDLADVFATKSEGIGGATAVEWRLVDEVVPRVRFAEVVAERAAELAARGSAVSGAAVAEAGSAGGVDLPRLDPEVTDDRRVYRHVEVIIDREQRAATITINGPKSRPLGEISDLGGGAPGTVTHAVAASAGAASAGAASAGGEGAASGGAGADTWSLRAARELDDAILHLRTNELEIGTWLLRTTGDPEAVLAHDAHWASGDRLGREITLLWKRVLKRLDVTSRSLIALVEPGSCFAGTLAELLFAADRAYLLDTESVTLGPANLGPYPMANGLTRLGTRFFHDPAALVAAEAAAGRALDAKEALALGLVTATPDDIDWEDEIRLAVEERASFSPDALTGLEANLRFVGPETMETKIFARLTAWQNWIFTRPNASGPDGALRRYGTGQRPGFDRRRV